jgi:hypothetical protein
MSPAEIVHRTVDVGRRTAWRSRQVRPGDATGPLRGTRTERSFAVPVRGVDRESQVRDLVDPAAAAAVIGAARRVLAGEWEVLGVVRTDSADPDWFADPVTGRRAPDQELAFRIHHRDESETGNIKQIWELSRHHHLTVLASAWWLTHDERYAEAVDAQLRSWWRTNPFLTGIHWTSGIEIGVRLIGWTWIRRLLDDWPKVGDLFEHNDDAVRQIGWHQQFLAGFRSRGTSANNHVIAEAAGLLCGACAFPWFAQSDSWRDRASVLLQRELAANTFPDGINRELASDYHRFVLELGLVAAVEADAAGRPLSAETWQLLARMLDAALAVVDVRGRAPRQNDGDEGRAIVVDDPELDPWAVAVGSGVALLGAPDWAERPSASVQAALFGAIGRQRRVARATARQDTFPDAGLTLLRSRPTDGPEIWCRCDSGPHGFLAIAAHAHADALSIELRHDGTDILADPGTYCYHGEPAWRAWLRSTAAHNTLEVGGVDQAESGGPFLWTTTVHTSTLATEVGDRPHQTWTAEHDGYRRLATPTTHRRSVTLDSVSRRLVVHDSLDADRPVPVTLAWQLGPEVEVSLAEGVAELSWPTANGVARGRLILPGSLDWSARRGELEPIAGWYAPRFGSKVPSWTLLGRGAADSATALVTEVELP